MIISLCAIKQHFTASDMGLVAFPLRGPFFISANQLIFNKLLSSSEY